MIMKMKAISGEVTNLDILIHLQLDISLIGYDNIIVDINNFCFKGRLA